ncbi:hypothetical protein BDQ12DRAFT_717351 [Crucibulum laeve]|uniref:Uncharacterized protein n=1 Tax=Crucibulum laeve TaxID=68775 RepID=A0A5C3MJX0_9AGAR|nr:hypothetical protein BDQ12DRAFT_717351 [Crucibulum laeve]
MEFIFDSATAPPTNASFNWTPPSALQVLTTNASTKGHPAGNSKGKQREDVMMPPPMTQVAVAHKSLTEAAVTQSTQMPANTVASSRKKREVSKTSDPPHTPFTTSPYNPFVASVHNTPIAWQCIGSILPFGLYKGLLFPGSTGARLIPVQHCLTAILDSQLSCAVLLVSGYTGRGEYVVKVWSDFCVSMGITITSPQVPSAATSERVRSSMLSSRAAIGVSRSNPAARASLIAPMSAQQATQQPIFTNPFTNNGFQRNLQTPGATVNEPPAFAQLNWSAEATSSIPFYAVSDTQAYEMTMHPEDFLNYEKQITVSPLTVDCVHAPDTNQGYHDHTVSDFVYQNQSQVQDQCHRHLAPASDGVELRRLNGQTPRELSQLNAGLVADTFDATLSQQQSIPSLSSNIFPNIQSFSQPDTIAKMTNNPSSNASDSPVYVMDTYAQDGPERVEQLYEYQTDTSYLYAAEVKETLNPDPYALSSPFVPQMSTDLEEGQEFWRMPPEFQAAAPPFVDESALHDFTSNEE